MLVSLRIENFALVDYLDLQLQAGLNVLTGETGAGKSIILDAIDAVLGGKASQRLIRSGEKKALLEATFAVNDALRGWVSSQQLDIALEDHLICTRELTASQGSSQGSSRSSKGSNKGSGQGTRKGRGSLRSRSRLNGVLVNKTQIEDLRRLLVEITAQGQTMQLGTPSLQLVWLDGFGGKSLSKQRQTVAAIYDQAMAARKALEHRRQVEQQRLQKLDLFKYECQELDAAQLADPRELALLQQEHQRLSHAVELQQQSYQVYQILYENDSGDACGDRLGKAEGVLNEMLRYDPEIEPILALVGEAIAQVEEAGRLVNAYGEGVETDPQRLQVIDQRMSQLKQLCRKYGRDLPELLAYYEEIQAALDLLNGDGQSLEALEQEAEATWAQLQADCAALTQYRQKTAKALETRLVKELKPLAMERVQFKVDIQPCAPSSVGADQIRFLFSPNPGEPLQPLAETASGGEMSRFLLALKACFSQIDRVGTLVFDEIDVGVSGRVAQAIAEKLHQLGRQHQVLCVTHQPIVAAMADTHFHVGKQVVKDGAPNQRRRTKPSPATSKPGEPAQGEITQGEIAQGETAQGETAQGEIAQGEITQGETTQGETTQGETAMAKPEERTVVRVFPLSLDERRQELAQLAGGQSHQEAIAFAESLLAQADTIRKVS